jgi:hypothetical protein
MNNYAQKLHEEFKKIQQLEKERITEEIKRNQELQQKIEKENLLNEEQVINQLSQLITAYDEKNGIIEFSENGSVIKVMLNNIRVPQQHKKSLKSRYIYDNNILYDYRGYVLDITEELKRKISELELKYLCCFDVNDKLCLVLGVKHKTTWNKIKSFFNMYNIPDEWSWKITEVIKK